MMRGCVCRWCGEAVTEADERYEAMDGTAGRRRACAWYLSGKRRNFRNDGAADRRAE